MVKQKTKKGRGSGWMDEWTERRGDDGWLDRARWNGMQRGKRKE